MKIYVSEKENIDLSKKCYLTFSTKDEQAVDWNVLAQSLEQHEKELLKEFADNIIKHLDFLTRHGYTDDQWEEVCISKGDVEDLIKRLLKERGVE